MSSPTTVVVCLLVPLLPGGDTQRKRVYTAVCSLQRNGQRNALPLRPRPPAVHAVQPRAQRSPCRRPFAPSLPPSPSLFAVFLPPRSSYLCLLLPFALPPRPVLPFLPPRGEAAFMRPTPSSQSSRRPRSGPTPGALGPLSLGLGLFLAQVIGFLRCVPSLALTRAPFVTLALTRAPLAPLPCSARCTRGT